MHLRLLAAALRDRCNARVLLQGGCVGEPFTSLAECHEEARSERGVCTGQCREKAVVREFLATLGKLFVESSDCGGVPAG
jgi:hypothetical protein